MGKGLTLMLAHTVPDIDHALLAVGATAGRGRLAGEVKARQLGAPCNAGIHVRCRFMADTISAEWERCYASSSMFAQDYQIVLTTDMHAVIWYAYIGGHAKTNKYAASYAGKHVNCSAPVLTARTLKRTLKGLARGTDTQVQAKSCPLAPATVYQDTSSTHELPAAYVSARMATSSEPCLGGCTGD